jgi:hypothetical protein
VANLGLNIWQGCVLIVIWAAVLIVVILMRNNVRNPGFLGPRTAFSTAAETDRAATRHTDGV